MKTFFVTLLFIVAAVVAPAASECENKPADILFLLDASSSIWRPNFNKQVAFVRTLVREFDISPTQTRVGVLTFGDFVREEFSLGSYLTKAALLDDGLARITQLTGTTRTDLAMQHMRTIFRRELRADVPKIAVVLTDGQSNHPNKTVEEAKLAHEDGITVFAIGVGRDVVHQELVTLATTEDNVFEVETHDALRGIRNILVNKTCTVEPFRFTLPPIECGSRPADVVFALDASSSIWGPDFLRQLHFVQDLVDSFEIGPEKTRVGVITFGDEPHREFHLNQHENETDLKAAIANIRQVRGTTNTAGALHRMRTHYFADHGREGVVKIGIVITDGQSNNAQATAHQAALAREAGIQIFAIGVGRRVNGNELLAIASEPASEFLFTVDNFSGLRQIRILLAKRTCEVTEAPSTVVPTTAMFPSTEPTTSIPSTPTPSIPRTLPKLPNGLVMLGDQAACAYKATDIVFALPSDADATRTNHGLNFIRSVSSRMDIGEEKVHVGVLPKDCLSVPGFHLKDGHGKEKVKALLEPDHYSSADTVMQLKMMRDHSFKQENGGRAGATKIGVLIVDKNSMDLSETKLEAWTAKELEGIELFVVGVGHKVREEELEALASQPTKDHIYRVDEYCDLLTVADHLTRRIDNVCAEF